MKKILFVLIALVVFSSCSAQKEAKIDKLTYLFTDASLPPEYHRSYEIKITPNGGEIKIMVYERVIKQTTFAVSPDTWQKLYKIAQDAQLKGIIKAQDNGVNTTGGTSHDIGTFYKDKPIGWYRWDSSVKEKINKKYLCFRDEMKKAVPDLQTLIESTRKKAEKFKVLVEIKDWLPVGWGEVYTCKIVELSEGNIPPLKASEEKNTFKLKWSGLSRKYYNGGLPKQKEKFWITFYHYGEIEDENHSSYIGFTDRQNRVWDIENMQKIAL